MTQTPEPHLILHKVRGLPQWDIAHSLAPELPEMWIIPTSGHRCYPFAAWPLNDLSIAGTPLNETAQRAPFSAQWPALTDHYQLDKVTPLRPAPLRAVGGTNSPHHLTSLLHD